MTKIKQIMKRRANDESSDLVIAEFIGAKKKPGSKIRKWLGTQIDKDSLKLIHFKRGEKSTRLNFLRLINNLLFHFKVKCGLRQHGVKVGLVNIND